ncbi:hypothetical protein TNIN_290621 [Trichonephila inaurata madagascariensis]|uniref:Uncharacterized protein n=1 Tax=Trichonephila inaurata madagascariensis TaxID=2747483 RepID=A0A8X6XIU8_9ARAC|nr:hypothetical protein TNIN_290621 [Trichonephila inaurata madagascariensis]
MSLNKQKLKVTQLKKSSVNFENRNEKEISNDTQKNITLDKLNISEKSVHKSTVALRKCSGFAKSCLKSLQGDGKKKCKDSSAVHFEFRDKTGIKTTDKKRNLWMEIEVYMPYVDVERNRLIPPLCDRPIIRWHYGKKTKSQIPKTSTLVNSKSALAFSNSKPTFSFVNNKSTMALINKKPKKNLESERKKLSIMTKDTENTIAKLNQIFMQLKIKKETNKISANIKRSGVFKEQYKKPSTLVKNEGSNNSIIDRLNCSLNEITLKCVNRTKKSRKKVYKTDSKAGTKKASSTLMFKNRCNSTAETKIKANNKETKLESENKTHKRNDKKSKQNVQNNFMPEREMKLNEIWQHTVYSKTPKTRRTSRKTSTEQQAAKNSEKKRLRTPIRHLFDNKQFSSVEFKRHVKHQQLVHKKCQGKLPQHKVAGSIVSKIPSQRKM